MNKHRYKATEVQRVNWSILADAIKDQRVVFGVDVAKEAFYGSLLSQESEVLATVKWTHPGDTPQLACCLQELAAENIAVVMEPSGTYGDSLRGVLKGLGFDIYQISPKRVHDAAEVFDGVPSLHDAKAAYIIGRLHLEGGSKVWREASEHRRDQQVLITELDLYQSEHRRNLNRLEAQLSRHWPELDRVTELDRASVLHLIAEYRCPEAVRAHRTEAKALMHRTGRGLAGEQRMEAIVDSADGSLGVPCTEGERHLLKTLANELLRTRKAVKALERRIAEQIEDDAELQTIGKLVGNTTSVVLESTLGSPLDYPNPHAYLKAAGLNLKERSSGKHKGHLKITKRGPGKARQYLYLSAMRLIQRDPVVAAWYHNKVERDGRIPRFNALVAVMRKLAMAVWHVAQGQPFDSRKLFNAKALGMS